MKKFLFTLAAVLAGFAANAQHTCELSMSTQEVTVVPGESVDVFMSLDALDHLVQGWQAQYVMRDVQGEPIDVSTGAVTLKRVKTAYWQTVDEGLWFPGTSHGKSTPQPGTYRILDANTEVNIIWSPDADDEFEYYPEFPGKIYKFTIQTTADWAEEYATMDFDDQYYKIVFGPGDNLTKVDLPQLDVKIINANYEAPVKDLTGEITFGEIDENGNVAVGYTGEEDVTFTVTVDGVEVELVDGMFNLGSYGDHTVVVTVSCEGYNSDSRTKIFTWEAPQVEVTETPNLGFEVNEEGNYVVTAEGAGTVILYLDGEPVENPYTIVPGEEEVTYTFTATAQEEGKEVSEAATLTVVVPAKPAPEVTEMPEFNYDPETFTIEAVGNGTVVMYVDGVEVENPYTFTQTEEEQTFVVTATAQEEGKEISEIATMTVVVPALVVVPEVTEMPVINYDPETMTVEAVGNGTVVLYVDGVEVENPYTFTQTEEEQTFVVTATAQEEGKEISETATQTVVIPALVVVPEVTETPTIVVEETDDAIVINVIGEGEIHLYVDGVEVEAPCTIEKTDEEQTFVVTATAQEEGKEISETATETVVVPAKASDDPHATGYWLVLIDKNKNEVWEPLTPGADTDWQTSVALTYTVYGTFDIEGGEERPNVDFYFVVDGVRYGAPAPETTTVLGTALDNPLNAESMDYYTVPVGYKYVLGIAVNDFVDNDFYVYAAQAGFVGVDELNADKAVAGVRYFNMAGQEMQQANGMTIVVTTYTDGTTSAVKVMK